MNLLLLIMKRNNPPVNCHLKMSLTPCLHSKQEACKTLISSRNFTKVETDFFIPYCDLHTTLATKMTHLGETDYRKEKMQDGDLFLSISC